MGDLLKRQDAQIAAIYAAEERYKQDGNLEALVSFWNELWTNGGLLFNGSKMHFRAVELNLRVGNNDLAWSLLQKISLRHPEYNARVFKYRYTIMKRERKYVGALEHLVDYYANDAGVGREYFVREARDIINKVGASDDASAEEIAETLADMAEKTKDVAELHDKLAVYYATIGWSR